MSDKIKTIIRSINDESVGKEGLSPTGDTYLHPEIMDDSHERKTNAYFKRLNKSLRKSRRTVSLIKSLQGGNRGKLNTSRLVRKRVAVRGKNGTVFYRMQWVDPNTGKPPEEHSAKQDQPNPKEKKLSDIHLESFRNSSTDPNHGTVLEATRKVTRNPTNRKEFVDHHVTYNMTREQKYEFLKQHGVDWKHNDHDAIDHKNAMVALKDFLANNIHLIGGEHMPEDSPEAEPGKLDWDKFWKQWMKHDDLYSKLMKENGIADSDPRLVNKAMGAIKHMSNVTKLKAHMAENPHLLQKYYNESPDTNAKKLQQTRERKPVPSPAEKGDNDIDTILNNMSRKRTYELMKAYGIADSDPAENPAYAPKASGGDGTAPIRHMRNKMALKKAIPLDPSKLNQNVEGGLTKEAIEHIDSVKNSSDERTKFDKKFSAIPTDIKKQIVEDFLDHEILENIKEDDNPAITHMRRLTAIKAHMHKHPELLDEYAEDIQNYKLLNMKIGVKAMAKFLRAHGYKKIGDVTRSPDIERSYEYRGGSTAEIMSKDDGSVVLSVIDMGEMLDEWNEVEFPMEEVKRWMDDLNDAIKVGQQAQSEKPALETQSLSAIFDTLDKDFDGAYNDAVGEKAMDFVSKLFVNLSERNKLATVSDLKANSGNVLLTDDTLQSLLVKYGTSFNMRGQIAMTDGWKRQIYKDHIHDTKQHPADWYISKSLYDRDTFILHESAKKWTSEERAEARKEVIKSRTKFEDSVPRDDHDSRVATLTDLAHKALSPIPFDLMTDVLVGTGKSQGMTLRYKGKGDGSYAMGASYNSANSTVTLPDSYYTGISSGQVNPNFTPDNQTMELKEYGSVTVGFHSFEKALTHEVGHAIDAHLSRESTVLNWSSLAGSKYLKDTGVKPTDPMDSVKSKIAQSGFEVGQMSFGGDDGEFKYTYYKDNWSDPYEGRIYDPAMTDTKTSLMYTKRDGKLISKTKGAEVGTPKSNNGSEHASIAFEHALRVHNRYQAHLSDDNVSEKHDSIVDFAKSMSSSESAEEREIGSTFVHMSENSPLMYNAVSALLHGKDFKE